MLTLNDERLMEDQLLTLASRAERFAAAFTRIFPPGQPTNVHPVSAPERTWLASLTSRAETPHAFLAELLVVGCERAGMRYSAEICDAIGVAVLDALQEVIGEAFTSRAREAWSRAFAVVSDGIDAAA